MKFISHCTDKTWSWKDREVGCTQCIWWWSETIFTKGLYQIYNVLFWFHIGELACLQRSWLIYLFFLNELQHILYRQKEQFSDGVGYSWIDGLKEHANNQVGCSLGTSRIIFIFPFDAALVNCFSYLQFWWTFSTG